jgi:hypothetical protein
MINNLTQKQTKRFSVNGYIIVTAGKGEESVFCTIFLLEMDPPDQHRP